MTPFEKVMGVYKKAEMLVESVHHNWKYAQGGIWVYYEGTYVGLTYDVTHELNTLFKEAGARTRINGRNVTVECFITDAEKTWVSKKRGYRG